MCGIAGYLDYRSNQRISQATVQNMLARIRHRGPDQFGVYMDAIAALGNARLSIIDLDAGQQPMATSDKRYWIVYNGEVFNHNELRDELKQADVQFKTRCDTEVVLHLYVRYGAECLHKLNGQFAIAIWDAERKELFLARDRLGIRPLFYYSRSNQFVFASEIKALAAHPAISLELDETSLQQVFTSWACLPPRTPFKGISQLPPGCYTTVSRNSVATTCYWYPEFGQQPQPHKTESEFLEELEGLLKDSTRLRLQADVPVGAYLSGGLDSSLTTALAREYAGERIDTFSIAFTDKAFDESGHQLRMARYLGTNHQVVEATHREIGEIFPEVVWHCETPLVRTGPAPMFLLSRLAHQANYKVVLTGEGADEFFAGYDIFKEAKIREFWSREPNSKRRPTLFQRIYPDLENLSKIGNRYLSSFFGDNLEATSSVDYSHRIRWKNTQRSQRFFSAEIKARLNRNYTEIINGVPISDQINRASVLEKAQYLEIQTFMSPYLLSSQGDRVAMANSLEGRYPFLDYRVSAFCSKLLQRHRMPALKDKILLRKLGKRYLPEEIWKRPKKPYRAPIYRSFFHDKQLAYVGELLSEKSLKNTGIFDPLPVKRLTTKITHGQGLGETDDMALAGILSTQLLVHLFSKSNMTNASLDPNDDVKIVDFRKTSSPQKEQC